MKIWTLLTASISIEDANHLATVYNPGTSTRRQHVGDGADYDLGLEKVGDIVEYMDTYVPDWEFGELVILYVMPRILTPHGSYDLVAWRRPGEEQIFYSWAAYLGIGKPVREDIWVIPQPAERKPWQPPRE